MRHLTLFTVLLLTFNGLFGQGFKKVYERSNTEKFFQFVKKEKGSYFIDKEGNYLIMNSPENFSIVNGSNGEVIASGKHLEKDDGVQLASNLLSGSTPGFMADGEALKESSGFFVFNEQNFVIFLDWTLDENIIKAFNIKTGEKVWETKQYRYTPERDDQMASVLATMAVNKAVRGSVPTSGQTASGVYYEVDLYEQHNYGSKDAQAFITPMEGTGAFLLKVQNKHVCLDLKTGEERWVYDDYPVNIAEHFMIKDGKEMVLVNFNPSYFAKSDNLIIKLDATTGEELLRIEHFTNYVKNRSYTANNRLILDYYGVEMYDLNSGEKLLSTIDERIVKAQNTMMSLMGGNNGEKNQQSIAYPSIVREGVLYTGTSRVGRQIHPLKPGSRNISIYAYDLKTGEELWVSEDTEHRSELVDVTADHIVLKHPKGLNKQIFYSLNKNTGEKVGESEKIKHYLLRNGAGHITTNETIIISGKKGIHVYNLDTWKKVGELDVKKSDVGKLQAMGLRKEGLFVIGDDGVGFFDGSGKHVKSVPIKRVEGSIWSRDNIIVFTKKDIVAIDPAKLKKAGDLELRESMMFSDNLKHWMLESSNSLTKYTLQN